MIVFIDESGIHKQTGHSTTAVVYIAVKNLDRVEKQILKILEALKIDSFHWAKHGWKIKEKFLRQIIDLKFIFKVALFENPVHPEKMLETVFQHLITEKGVKRLFIDGKKPKWYERKLKKVLRDKGLSIRKLKTVRKEESFPGLQLADCLAGLIRYHYDNPESKDAKRWFRKLKREKKLFAQIIFEKQS